MFSLLQADHRYCQSAAPDTRDYWWATAAINGRWASRRGYAFICYCVPLTCASAVGEVRHVAFCKLLALMHALQSAPLASVLYLDSDVVINRLSGFRHLLRAWAPCNGVLDQRCGDLLFGGNAPYMGPGRWHGAVLNQSCPPNSGIVLARNSNRTMRALLAWWRVPADRFATRHAWEQRVLWQSWRRLLRLPTTLRVLADTTARVGGSCLRSMFRLPSASALGRLPASRPVARAPFLHLDSGSVCGIPGLASAACAAKRRALLAALPSARRDGVTFADGRPRVVALDVRALNGTMKGAL